MIQKSPFDYIPLSNCRFPRLVVNPRNPKQVFGVRCRHCANCRIVRRSQLETMANFELLDCYKKGLSASFVTLTYSPDFVPVKAFSVKTRQPISTLDYQDFRHFMFRVRSYMRSHGQPDFKILWCGEYGQKNGQPHYHFCAFGVNPLVFEKVCRKEWYNHGIIDFGALSSGGIRYIISYLDVSVGGRKAFELYTKCGCEPPKVGHSPHLGKNYVAKHLNEFKGTGMNFLRKGKLVPLPKNVRESFGYFHYRIPDKFYFEQLQKANALHMDVVSYQQNKFYLQEYDNINRFREKGVPFSSQSLLSTPFNSSGSKQYISNLVKEVFND